MDDLYRGIHISVYHTVSAIWIIWIRKWSSEKNVDETCAYNECPDQSRTDFISSSRYACKYVDLVYARACTNPESRLGY